VESSYINYIGE